MRKLLLVLAVLSIVSFTPRRTIASDFIAGGPACPGCTCWVTESYGSPYVLTCVDGNDNDKLYRCAGNPPVMCMAFQVCMGRCSDWG